MKIAIVTNTSDNIRDLSVITLQNKRGYATKHGYELFCKDFDYQRYNEIVLDHLHWRLEILKSHDVMVVMGADTMFTNWNIRIEDVLANNEIMIARERMWWWPINDDVMIWRNLPGVIRVFRRIIQDFSVWKQYPWRKQAYIWNKMQEEQEFRDMITLVEPEVMNQHPSKWQLGNWIVHFYGMPVPDKIRHAKQFQKRWPDGNPVWKVKMDGVRPPEPGGAVGLRRHASKSR